jgi:hypothetical protein
MLIIEASASRIHVLEEQGKRIGEDSVVVGAYGVDGRRPCSGIGVLQAMIGPVAYASARTCA